MPGRGAHRPGPKPGRSRGAKRITPQPVDPNLRQPEALEAVDGLTDDRERLFVYYYVLRPDVQWAGMSAGYAKATVLSKCYQWVQPNGTKPRIYEAVQRALAKHAQKLEITTERVLQGLAELAFSNALDFGDVDEDGAFHVNLAKATRSQFAAVQELSVHQRQRPAAKKGEKQIAETNTKIKLAEKRPALVDLGRHLGIFKDDGAAAQTVHLIIKGAE